MTVDEITAYLDDRIQRIESYTEGLWRGRPKTLSKGQQIELAVLRSLQVKLAEES